MKAEKRLIFFTFIVLIGSGCGRQKQNGLPSLQPGLAPKTLPSASTFPREIKDGRGKTLILKSPPQHIVSLVPSATEILYALGVDDRLVLDTTSCDYPPDATHKPHVDALHPNIEPIEIRNPDLVIAQDGLNSRLIPLLESAHVPIFVYTARTLKEIYTAIHQIGQATGAEVRADEVVHKMKTHIDTVAKSVGSGRTQPRVLIMYSQKPIYTTGPNSFISELIAIAGGRNIVTTALPNDIISTEQVIARQPDIIICSASAIPTIRQIPGWSASVPAVVNNRFYALEDAFTRPGPRLADAVEHLAKFLHPDLNIDHDLSHHTSQSVKQSTGISHEVR